METQLSTDPAALALFFTEEIFVVEDPAAAPAIASATTPADAASAVPAETVPAPAAQPVIAVPEVLAQSSVPAMPVTGKALPATEKAEPRSFPFVGRNARNVVILVNDPVNDVSTEAGRELLRKIVKSVNLSGNDFALVNHARHPEAVFADYASFFANCQFLVFGVTADALQIPAQTLHQHSQVLGHGIVLTAELDALNGDNTAKKELWGTLQKLNFSS
ncbi:hypothetical protein [Pedobacter sp. SYP-B3415]|uniref:hypothetical protein n=1 Tax=Pedobacter sp. SYP-B3415 TaxID=2496641 RepID=UPI00101D9094|nr:hypothetical protein [Pedobacter sp. SYP-B3415]